jgi:hypothetical protein
MSADRLLATVRESPTNADAPPADVRAERKRVMDALTVVIDDCLRQWNPTGSAIADALVKGFALELATLARFVRTGMSAEGFAELRRGDGPAEHNEG